MKTRAEFAVYVEVADFIADDTPSVVGYVESIEDDGDYISLTTRDEDGDTTILAFAPFDEVTIIESFEEDGSVPDEWEHFYAEDGPFDRLALVDEAIDSVFKD